MELKVLTREEVNEMVANEIIELINSKENPYSLVHFLIKAISAGAGPRPLIPNAFKI